MADLKISQLTGATTPLAGSEVLPIVQSSATRQVSVANLTAGRAVSGTSFSATTWLAGQAPRQNPNNSGSTVDYALRVADNVASITLDMGQSNVPAVNTAWMQVRAQSNFAVKYNLAIQPNGGQVTVGTMTTPAATTAFSISGGDVAVATAGRGILLPGGISWTSGAGSPEGVVTAPIGSLYSRSDGGVLTSLYVKQSGSGNTGWAGK